MRRSWLVSALVISASAVACSSSTSDTKAAPDAGAEAGTPDGSTAGCSDTQKSCSGTCVSLFDPTSGCATAACTPCAGAPNATPSCRAGACHFQCNAGFSDCDGDPANGCETNIGTDALNCGACHHSCDGGTCTAGKC